MLYDRDRDDREAIADGIASKRGATLVRPYDDPFVIAGQGTAGREIAEDMAALASPDIVVAPASGGGLIAGVAIAVKARFPEAKVMSPSRKVMTITGVRCGQGTASPSRRKPHHLRRADGRDARRDDVLDQQQAARPGRHATDTEVGAAVAYAWRELKLVVEPGGAVGLAALLAGHIDVGARTSSSCCPAAMSMRICYGRLIN